VSISAASEDVLVGNLAPLTGISGVFFDLILAEWPAPVEAHPGLERVLSGKRRKKWRGNGFVLMR
jgi:hypothetical protein